MATVTTNYNTILEITVYTLLMTAHASLDLYCDAKVVSYLQLKD
jgi:hypothetical protein